MNSLHSDKFKEILQPVLWWSGLDSNEKERIEELLLKNQTNIYHDPLVKYISRQFNVTSFGAIEFLDWWFGRQILKIVNSIIY